MGWGIHITSAPTKSALQTSQQLEPIKMNTIQLIGRSQRWVTT